MAEGAAFCVEHPALCSENGVASFFKALEDNNIHGAVVAACSPRFKPGIFDHEKILTERVNLREQVAWVMEPGSADMQMAAEDYLKMGIAKARGSIRALPFNIESVSTDILVIGAGITGITAAVEAAAAGYVVHLVEKEARPGGYASKLAGQIPFKEPFNKIAEPSVYQKIEELGMAQNINLYTETSVKSIKGQPGNFDVTLNTKSEKLLKVGAIVSAMGWKPYDATKLDRLGYGKSTKVITNLDFEHLVAEKRFEEIPDRVLFIQCAGSRDPEPLPYCSNNCCGTSLKQAAYIRKKNPQALRI